jgi:hypothetical protein
MGIASFFKSRREDKFLRLLIEQSQLTVDGLKLLEACLPGVDQAELEKMRQQEYAADEVRRILIDELHKTFVTPLDREDIFNLSLNIDEMLDYALTTIEEMLLLEVEADEYLTRMVSFNRQAAEELAMAMLRLKDNPRVAGDHARRARKFEDEVERLYRQAIADLFSKAKDLKPLLAMLRRREVYRHVSNMADRASAAANVVGMVVMKLT